MGMFSWFAYMVIQLSPVPKKINDYGTHIVPFGLHFGGKENLYYI